MSTTLTRIAVAAAAVAAIPISARPAFAADGVFGGSTSAGDPIALTAAPNAAKLTSAVISWRADCGAAGGFADASAVTATAATPGFSPGSGDLLMSRNGKGRFKGTQLFTTGDSIHVVVVSVVLEGKLAAKRASGTLSAVAKIVERATGNAAGSCQTGHVRWAAARTPGRIYAGKTSQEEPVVVRLDASHKKVSDVLTAWKTQTCTPDNGMGWRYAERFVNFRVTASGAFGNPFAGDDAMDGGLKRHFEYAFAGRLAKRAAHGTLRVTMADTDAAGAQQLSCDSGAITWKAVTG